jgi:hypothetical protein
VLSKNRCLQDGDAIQVSAPAGSFPAGSTGSVFIVECNVDTKIPDDGSGCDLGGLQTVAVGADGSVPATEFTIKLGKIGSDAAANCPPSQSQADAGAVNCMVVASLNGEKSNPAPVKGAFTTQGQSVVLPVDSTGSPLPPPASGSSPTDSGGQTAVTAAASGTSTTLAFTGATTLTWWLLGIGVAVLDLGYLAVSATWTKRRSLRRS